MKLNSLKRFRLPTVLPLVIAVVVIKLVLSFGYFAMHREKVHLSLSTPEVMAEEQKKGSKNAAASPKTSQPSKGQVKGSALAPSTDDSQPSLTSLPDTLSYIEKKEAELRQKEDQLKRKEEYLNQMEKDVEKKLNDLISVQKEINSYRSEKEQNQNTKVRSLAKIYGSMKPKEAGKLLENLDDKLVVNIISTMNANEAANILANMEVKKAAKISEALTANR